MVPHWPYGSVDAVCPIVATKLDFCLIYFVQPHDHIGIVRLVENDRKDAKSSVETHLAESTAFVPPKQEELVPDNDNSVTNTIFCPSKKNAQVDLY